MSKPATLFQKLSLYYKITRFPWKKHALIGYDLKGNQYWDCPNPLGGRMKRWVQMYDKKENDDLTVFSQDKLPVQWVSWLRHTRTAAPTINDLIQEERRREMVQGRAKALDQQWAKRKLELQKIQEDEQLEVNRLSAIDKAEEQKVQTTQPTGQGDTFSPGEWNPTRSKR
ncbi:hypothetical protein EDC94DRAFT_629878 [Helicostylum pulchrum]|uniref:NADH dehydrogenase [ubiquinone] 1 alpha subcomplex subunit 12 n=1 Tax=Helicostylum pulchrum TaxID=562976 RepID=A0ABP9Y9I5_9FUNG|nr:hypothetical protein EDC94DRAFT_629878 [Helicostylum pulchrum]